MKASHMRAPRTMGEGDFARGYTTQPVGRRARGYPRAWWFVVGLCAGFALAIAAGV